MENELVKDTDSEKVTPDQEIISEIEEDLVIRQQRRRMFPRAALVGLLAGLVAALFRAVLAAGDTLRNHLITWSQQYPLWGWIFPILFSIVGAVLAVLLVQR